MSATSIHIVVHSWPEAVRAVPGPRQLLTKRHTDKTLTRETYQRNTDSGFTITIKMHQRNTDTLV